MKDFEYALGATPLDRGSYHVGVKSAIFAASSQRKIKIILKPTGYDFLLLANTR